MNRRHNCAMRASAPKRRGSEGFTLAGLIVILTIIALVVAYTVPDQWSLIMKRERERQTIFIMKQYARGILQWQRKHNGTLPVSLQQLQDAREPLMLRNGGKWPCPLTGREEDWILVPDAAVGQQGQPGVIPQPNDDRRGRGQGRGRGAGGGGGASSLDPNNAGQAGAGGNQIRPPSKLDPAQSPADYVGPFVGVRPRATGKSYISLNGAEDYGQWVYTVHDLRNEILMRQAAMQRP